MGDPDTQRPARSAIDAPVEIEPVGVVPGQAADMVAHEIRVSAGDRQSRRRAVEADRRKRRLGEPLLRGQPLHQDRTLCRRDIDPRAHRHGVRYTSASFAAGSRIARTIAEPPSSMS